MRRGTILGLAAALSVAAGGSIVWAQADDDGAFAGALWEQIAGLRFVGDDALGAVPYAREGQAHGETLVTLQSTVTIDGVTGAVLVKRSYGEGATRDGIIAHPNDNLENITVMFQREAGYDPANGDWFWAMYAPDGMVGAMEGMTMAGRVGMCSGCHAAAPGGDYIFLHDGLPAR